MGLSRSSNAFRLVMPWRCLIPISVKCLSERQKVSQLGQALQFLEPRVGDLGADKVQHLQALQPLEMHETTIANGCEGKV